MGMFYVVNIAVVVIRLYTFGQAHQIVHIKLMNSVVCKLSLILILKYLKKKKKDGSKLSVEGSWDLPTSENSGREAWERKWDEKEPGKFASSFGISLVAKR